MCSTSTEFGQGISNKISSTTTRPARHTVTHVTQISEDYFNEDLDPICTRTTRSTTCQLKSSRVVIKTIKIDFVTSCINICNNRKS
jgi:hypothetical protein